MVAIPLTTQAVPMNATATLPEYLHIFGEDGPVAVEVHGPAGPLPLPARRICAEDIAWLVSGDGQERAVLTCELDPVRQCIRLRVA
jgi:hypothetical protein